MVAYSLYHSNSHALTYIFPLSLSLSLSHTLSLLLTLLLIHGLSHEHLHIQTKGTTLLVTCSEIFISLSLSHTHTHIRSLFFFSREGRTIHSKKISKYNARFLIPTARRRRNSNSRLKRKMVRKRNFERCQNFWKIFVSFMKNDLINPLRKKCYLPSLVPVY